MKIYIQYWLFVFFLIPKIQSAQENINSCLDSDFVFDKESFLIGILSDISGHQQTFTSYRDSLWIRNFATDSVFIKLMSQQNISVKDMIESANEKYQFVDAFYTHTIERNLASLIHSLFIDEYPDLQVKIGVEYPDSHNNENVFVMNGTVLPSIRLHSGLLSKRIDSYYDYKPDSAKTVFSDTVYIGYLKPEKFQTRSQKLSFLAGVMLRKYPMVDSGKYYHISMQSSLNKATLCHEFLIAFDCINVLFKHFKNYDIVVNTVYFEPSETISKLIEKVKAIRKKLENNDFEEQFPNAKQRWQEEAEKLGLK
jgi:hypothetical protein